jgi:hypothetical protein
MIHPARDVGFFHVRNYPTRLRNVGGSTQVKLENQNVTYTVLVCRKTQSHKKNTSKTGFEII